VYRGSGVSGPASASPASDLHAAGILALRWHDETGAVEALEEARDREPGAWWLRNDLAAAYVLRALDGDSAALLAALSELDAAAALAPDAPEVRFNRAYVLQRLSLLEEAERAWRSFLDLRPPPGWRAEAEDALAEVARRRAAADGSAFESRLTTALRRRDAAEVARLVEASPQDAVHVGEEKLLGAWAQNVLGGNAPEAVEALERARLLGRALRSTTGDAFVSATSERLLDVPPGEWPGPATAYAELMAGRRHYEARELRQAEERFRRARRAAGPTPSPVGHWIDYYLTLCRYWRGDAAVFDRFVALREVAEAASLPILRGYLDWMTGVMHLDAGRLAPGVADYREARGRFEAAGLRSQAGMLRVLEADALVRLGDLPGAWDTLSRALARAEDYRNARHLAATWDQAGQLATLLGRPEVAPYFLGAALDAALRSPSPLSAVNSHVAIATAWSRLGEHREARRRIAEARAWVARIADPDVRRRAEADLLLAEARATEPGREEEAVRRLSGAIRRWDGAEADVLLPGIYLERARLLLATGRFDEGDADLRAALGGLELARRSIDDVEWRVSFTSVSREALELLLRHHLGPSGDREAVPALTDLARDPAYFAPLAPRAVEELLDSRYHRRLSLGPGEGLLSVTVLEDRLVLWLARGEELLVAEEPVASEEVYRRVRAVAVDPSKDDLAWLHDRIVRPLQARLDGVERLYFALDRGLHQLPVGALVDQRSGRFLVEERAVAVVPAAIVLAEERGRRPGTPVERLAVAGSPGSPAVSGLPMLPEVEGELTGLLRLYPEARRLEDPLTAAALEAAGGWGDVLHYSGHAVSNPLVPRMSRLITGDGAIWAGEIRRLRFARARTVVLASCETAVTTPRDSSGVLSLAVAFLEAGADWVVASLWPVEDRAARRFAERFHRELRQGLPPDEALRRTQLHLLQAGGDYGLRDWAAYQVLTD